MIPNFAVFSLHTRDCTFVTSKRHTFGHFDFDSRVNYNDIRYILIAFVWPEINVVAIEMYT